MVYVSSSFILHRHLLSIGANEQHVLLSGANQQHTLLNGDNEQHILLNEANEQHILLNEANEQTGYTLDAVSKTLRLKKSCDLKRMSTTCKMYVSY